jgi:UDP-N-acetylglucosamine acyltransferase
MAIHPSAIIHPGAKLDVSVEVGPYCVIGADVEIGAGTRLMGHLFVEGPLSMGEDNILFPFSSIGVASQDLKYRGERSETRIGSRNRIREFVTIHRGTAGGGMVTCIGDDNLIMAYSHIAHDVRIGNHCILVNGATLGGHVVIEDWAEIAGLSAVHQFCRVGKHAIVGGGSIVTRDVLPYSMTVEPRDGRLVGANKIGLERRNFPAAAIDALHKTFRLLKNEKLNTTQAVEKIRAEVSLTPEVAEVLEFIEKSQRGVIK